MDFEMFMAGKAAVAQEVEYVASERFKDADGKPIAWKLKPLDCVREKALKKQCIKDGRLDTLKYQSLFTAESVTYPDLGNAALQDSYHVMGKEALLEAMLLAGELNLLTLKVQSVNGYDKTINDLVNAAKN